MPTYLFDPNGITEPRYVLSYRKLYIHVIMVTVWPRVNFAFVVLLKMWLKGLGIVMTLMAP